jgi:hypothetical protein
MLLLLIIGPAFMPGSSAHRNVRGGAPAAASTPQPVLRRELRLMLYIPA